jgi:site-specific recombinase XerD
MTDAELIDAYDADQAFRNLQPGTRHVRRRYLAKFSREVGFTTATEQKVVAWLGRPMSAKTRAMWISTINSFYSWVNHNHLFADTEQGDGFNPVLDIGKPRLHARSPRPMAKADLQRALELADDRMRAWLLLGSLAGCRCMEIAGLQREDVREEQGVLRLIGKGDKERFVPLHADVLDALNTFGMPAEGSLWGQESAASVSRKINTFLHKEVGTKSTAHTLRHAFGTNVYQMCHDLRLTQELMGHSSPQTTAGYAAADQSQAAGVVGSLRV